ncbi:MAG: flagellar basal body rod protein FlgC [Planctomycetes bacterium]|nr:flagellar basal body rod protein FlgC [Planctomycetota bacterium]
MFESFDTSISGLVAHRVWLDTIQSNIANMSTTRDAEGRLNPYQRRFPIFMTNAKGGNKGVEVAAIQTDPGVRLVSDPGHPDAIKSGKYKGYVRMPDISLHVEMTNAIVAQRTYEANITALQVSKQMYMSDLQLLA